MPEIPAPTDHTTPKSQLPVGLLLRGGSPRVKVCPLVEDLLEAASF
jgi:hypothetical protein